MYIGDFLKTSSRKPSGLNSPIAESRQATSELLGMSFKAICGLTRGWTNEQIYRLLREAQVDGRHPAKFWWYLYKQKKIIYGKEKTNKKGLHKLGEESGRKKQEKRQSLF